MKLASYVADRWVVGADAGVAVRDATTGVVVAEVGSAGIDFAPLQHATVPPSRSWR